MIPPVDTHPADVGEAKPALKIDASSLSHAVKATIPSKMTKYDPLRSVDELYRKHATSLRSEAGSSLHEKVAFEIYLTYRPRIIKIARKYRSLSVLFGEDDLQQEALIAILQALQKYKHSADIRMKFSTYLEWSVRNIFQRAIGGKDIYVEIYDRAGAFKKTMDWGAFVEEKKALEDAGCTSTTKRRLCYFSETLLDQDLEPGLRGLRENAYDVDRYGESSEDAGDVQGTRGETEREGGEDEAVDGEEHPDVEEVRGASDVLTPEHGLTLQIIDGLYRQWARSRGISPVTESEPIVLRIYGLYREQGEALFLPFRSNGTALSAEKVRRSILSAIVRGLTSHDNDAVPSIPFSLSLRVAMGRSLKVLQKRQHASEEGGDPEWMKKR